MNISYIAGKESILPRRKRVAAYARVSSGKDASLHSLSSQISFYSGLIQRNHDWEYAGVYADEALTGTKDNRPEFQRMIRDCKDGKIDIVLTKSISRFARNTVTTVETVRLLKSYGVDVWFERENIHSISGDGEFMLTILSSFAQEESLSASENQKWKIRKNFEEGRPTAVRMMGYRQENDEFFIVPEEAEIVRMIFNMYLSGMGRNAIVKKLMELDIPCKNGGNWSESTVWKMLQNEKYAGDLLLQKTFVVDHISKKKQKNTGELPQYLIEGNHEAIIDRDTFQRVQEEIARRRKKHTPTPSTAPTYEFTKKIICEQCGKYYRRKILSGGKVVWICSTFNRLGKAHCSSQQIPEEILKGMIGNTAFSEIRIPCANTVKIVRPNGKVETHTWQNPSRSESWTAEMKETARKRRNEWQQKRP